MNLYKHQNAEIKLSLQSENDLSMIAKVCNALGNETRLKILRIFQRPPHLKTLPELSKELNIPQTTLLHHLNVMEKANVISVTYKSNKNTTLRFFGRDMRSAYINFYYNENNSQVQNLETQSLGVGQFADFFGESFGFCTSTEDYSFMVDKCFSPARYNAQLIFTNRGIISYYFNNNTARYHNVTEISLSLEICSEAPYYDNEHKSDVTFWLNGKEIYTHLCMGDYGDRRGYITPSWWGSQNTQYGKLLTLTVNKEGVFVNGSKVSSKVTIEQLDLKNGNKIILSFGNKDTTEHPGGFNIFGKEFGDYPQDIILTCKYDD